MVISDEKDILELIRRDGWRMSVLKAASRLNLPDWWIGSGFVRAAVWDGMFGRSTVLPDVDVIYLDGRLLSKEAEKGHEAELARLRPDVPWSVKNQARMHSRNDDVPYASCADAIRCWPETASAVAVKTDAAGELRLLAPLGLDDLLAGIIRPTPRFRSKMDIFRERQAEKDWRSVWPQLRRVEE